MYVYRHIHVVRERKSFRAASKLIVRAAKEPINFVASYFRLFTRIHSFLARGLRSINQLPTYLIHEIFLEEIADYLYIPDRMTPRFSYNIYGLLMRVPYEVWQ